MERLLGHPGVTKSGGSDAADSGPVRAGRCRRGRRVSRGEGGGPPRCLYASAAPLGSTSPHTPSPSSTPSRSLPAHPRPEPPAPRLSGPGTPFSPARLPPREAAGAAGRGGERRPGQRGRPGGDTGRWAEPGGSVAIGASRRGAGPVSGRGERAAAGDGGGGLRLPGGQRPVGAGELLPPEACVRRERGSGRPRCAFPRIGLLKGFYLHWNGFEGVNEFIDSGAALAACLDFPGSL